MPTIFERLDAALQGNDLSVRLTTQTGRLSAVATTVANLINNPPDSLGDLGGAINELPLPDLAIDSRFVTSLNALRNAVPTDLRSVTGVLTDGLQQLGGTIDSEITALLGKVLRAIQTVHALTQIEFTCSDAGGPDAMPGPVTPPLRGQRRDVPVAAALPEPSPIAAARARLDDALTLLNAAPTDAEGLLGWLADASHIFDRENGLMLPLPLLYEWIDPLQTLQAWKTLDPAAIRAHIAATLQALSAFVRSTAAAQLSALTSDLAATAAHLHTTDLAQIATDLVGLLAPLRTAVNSGALASAGTTVAQLNTRLDDYETLRTTMQAAVLAGLPALNARLRGLPDELADDMCHLLAVVQPNALLSILQHLPSVQIGTPPGLEQLQALLQPLVDWLQNLADQLDLSVIQEPLQTVANSIRSALDRLDQELANIAVQVRALFAQVEALVDTVDTAALLDQAEAAIDAFAQQLTQQLTALFQPARSAVAAIVQQIDQGIAAFDPEDIIDALQQALGAVTGVLQDPDVVSALGNIRSAVEATARQLEQLSFAPLTDQVIAAIDQITAALEAIDTAALNVAAQAALQAALAVLPDDLTPITDPFIVEFGQLVESGPVPLLNTVQQQPQLLLARAQQFQPFSLVGEALSAPFQQLLAQMHDFTPSRLLAPVASELDKLKDRLRARANPAALLEGLEQPFNQLLQAFDQLQPEALVQPLEGAITGLVNRLLEVLPVDALFDQLDAVLAPVQEVVAFGQSLVNLLQRVQAILQGLSQAQNQFETWIDTILDKVEAIGDTSSLQPRFAELNAALDATQATALSNSFQAATGPLLTALNALNAQAKLAALGQAYGTFPHAALAALPDSAEKTALSNALTRFTPLDPAFSAPYRDLAAYQQALTGAQSSLQALLASWDARYHHPDGLLHALRHTGATAAELRQWVEEALEPQLIRPLSLLFTVIEPLAAPVSAFATVLTALVTALQSKLTALLAGPAALTSIRNDLQALMQRLRNFNLAFLRQSVNEVFASVRNKVAALNPAALRQPLESAFNGMLDTITVDQVLPPDQVAALDADYTTLLNKLADLDPQRLVIDVVQPQFESTVQPLLAAFDLTGIFTALLDRLRALDEELRQEMARVNEAYQRLRGAVPSLSVSVDIDLGF
jgi:hypothetical protein